MGLDGKNYLVLKSHFARPEQIYIFSKRHPEVPVIMAHFGGPENAKKLFFSEKNVIVNNKMLFIKNFPL